MSCIDNRIEKLIDTSVITALIRYLFLLFYLSSKKVITSVTIYFSFTKRTIMKCHTKQIKFYDNINAISMNELPSKQISNYIDETSLKTFY